MLAVVFSLFSPVHAETPVSPVSPVSPVITVLKNNTNISISWEPVNNSEGYQLFYAPFPYLGADTVASIDIGDMSLFSAELWESAAYYVAVVAKGNENNSHFSNIALFFISSPALEPDAAPLVNGNWYRPEVGISWHWQRNERVNENYAADLYDIDLFDSSAQLIDRLKMSGKKVICYFSAGSYENFRTDKDRFNANELGNTLDGWPDEQWLDIRSENVANIMIDRLDLAALKGCDGVEPDNMEAYLNDSGFDLNARDQLAFNKFIANEAHKRGLAVGLKNDLEQIDLLVDFFDFSINEQCHEYDECDALQAFINKEKPLLPSTNEIQGFPLKTQGQRS